ncbi:outer membrane beta-barrel protein [uncultured Parabacteroides sp.]|uniref:outer membrane beta-barrel protein n=1 Tax=uncultured Parabacteroides sp. TaxID=512312 RepID=UPI0025CCA3D8|nr:outer membrane beta-barrel protein [uncultured Parabacteroides sp.]
MAEKDNLINEYRKRNAGYELLPPSDGWERLEAELPPARRSRFVLYRWVAAAAVLLLLVAVPLYYYGEKKSVVVPALTDSKPVKTVPESVPIPDSGREEVPVENSPLLASAIRPKTGESLRAPVVVLSGLPSGFGSVDRIAVRHDLQPIRRTSRSWVTVLPPANPSFLHVPERRRRTDKGWNISVYGGNMLSNYSSSSAGLGMFNFASVSAEVSPGGGGNIDNAPSGGSMDDFRNDLQSNASNFRTKSEYAAFEEVALHNYNIPTQTKIEHRFPVSAGLSVQKSLSGRLALESGLVYTYLSSDLSAGEDSHYQQEQRLHYLGIPLKVNYAFWRDRRLSLYASAGGMAEMCVDSSLKSYYYVAQSRVYQSSTDLDVDKVQLSVTGALGAQLNIVKSLSLYAEPGVVYYFDDKSGVETIRKEHPFNFRVHFGIRFSF